MKTDHHFPRYHVRSPSGYVNDPNGPILIDGIYHLYFQYVQDTPREGPVHWGHATSADLVEWMVHPPALRAEPGGLDAGGCWSGNTVVTDDHLYAFYSVFEPGNAFQPVFRAESSDGGATFGDRRPAVAGPDPAEQAQQFRDPFVWWHFGRWCMLAGAELPGGVGQARLYESDDLKSWRYIGPFVQSRGSRVEGAMWECPQYATFGEEGVLLIAAYHPRGDVRHVIALRGRESATALVDSSVSRLDAGLSFYAPSVLRGPDRNLVWGWATEERHRDWEIEADWSGCLTLPRELRLGADGAVLSFPAAELTGLRAGVIGGTGHQVAGLPAQFEVELRLRAPQGGAASVLTLAAAADETVVLTVEWDTGRVVLDRSAASRDERASGGRSEFVDPQIRAGREVGLRWFLDGSIGELFSDSGRVLTHRLYPTQPPPWILALEPGGAAAAELIVHRIRDAVRH